ncbi:MULTISPECIES: hypothetical protein [Mesorhizobium]|uniref:hypothetical protein n=1 Tax=Mesorhizobium TaxID=68287 RepID=UPI001FCE90AE|nr:MULTISPECIES: hypothetical protein [Mesorhizobium]
MAAGFALSAEQRRADGLTKARRRIVELERKIGKQQVELDFFQEALRQSTAERRTWRCSVFEVIQK